jgi:hypothetical protein
MEIARDQARMLSLAAITALCSIRPNRRARDGQYTLEQNFAEPAPEKAFFSGAIVERGNYGMGLWYKNCRTFEPSRA